MELLKKYSISLVPCFVIPSPSPWQGTTHPPTSTLSVENPQLVRTTIKYYANKVNVMQIEFRSCWVPLAVAPMLAKISARQAPSNFSGRFVARARSSLPDFYGKHTSAVNNNNAQASLEFFFVFVRAKKKIYIFIISYDFGAWLCGRVSGCPSWVTWGGRSRGSYKSPMR